MADLSTVSRVLYDHDWVSTAEWANTFRSLADLTDEQIDQISLLSRHCSSHRRHRQPVEALASGR